MKYLLIENEGISSVEGFTIFGLSTSRGTEKIGQFGSGVKHAILLLLRERIKPTIFLGNDFLSFDTKESVTRDGKEFQQVFYTLNGIQTQTSYCTEFGELDWDNIEMALREFISNAIDASTDSKGAIDHSKWNVAIVSAVEARSTKTRVYIPLTPAIQDYYDKRDQYFLYFKGTERLKFIPKNDKSTPRIYRKGVFIRQLQSVVGVRSNDSIFDYNFGDEMKIDECRNLNDYQAISQIGRSISSDDSVVEMMFNQIKNQQGFFELSIPYQCLHGNGRWPEIWKKVASNTAISNEPRLNKYAERRGVPVVLLPVEAGGWYREMRSKGVLDIGEFIGKNDKHDVVIVKTRNDTIKIVKELHSLCIQFGMHANKPIPKIGSFMKNTVGGEALHGYFDSSNETVYISALDEHATNKSCILEELAHYYTGAEDFTRDIQNFGYLFASRCLSLLDG